MKNCTFKRYFLFFQDQALDALLTVSNKLKSDTEEDISSDVIEGASLTVFEGLGNILKASSNTQAKIREKQDNNETIPEEETEHVRSLLFLNKLLYIIHR